MAKAKKGVAVRKTKRGKASVKPVRKMAVKHATKKKRKFKAQGWFDDVVEG